MRCPPESVRTLASPGQVPDDALGGGAASQVAGFSSAPSPERLGDRQLRVQRLVLGDERHPDRASAGVAAEDRDRALAGAQEPGGEGEQGGLACAVGPDERADASRGQPERAAAQRPAPGPAPVPHAEAVRLDRGDCHVWLVPLERAVQYGGEERVHVVAFQSRLPGSAGPVVEFPPQGRVRGGRGAEGPADECAEPAPGLDQTFAFQLAVGLEHGVRVDGGGLDDLACGGQPVAGLQQAEAEGLFGLLDDLEVRGDAAAPVDAELDRCGLCHVHPFH